MAEVCRKKPTGLLKNLLKEACFLKIIHRYLAEIYRRVNDPSLARFFLENRTFMDEHILIPKHLDNVSGPSRSWRLSIYRSVSASCDVLNVFALNKIAAYYFAYFL